MAAEAASALGLSVAVLAESTGDAACAVAAEVLVGSPLVEADLRSLAERSEVLTFDHEQVDLIALRALADDGVVIRPGLRTLEMAVDKAHMRASLVPAGIPVPAHVVVDLRPGAASPAVDAIERFAVGTRVAARAQDGSWRLRRQGGVAGGRRGGRRRGGGRGRRHAPGRRDGAAPGRAGRHGGPASRRRDGHLAGSRDGSGRRGVPGGPRPGAAAVGGGRRGPRTGPAGGGDLGGGGRAGGGALLGPRVAAGQRDRRPAPQLGPLDDGGIGHLPVREPPAGRPRPAPRADGAPARGGGQRERLRGR